MKGINQGINHLKKISSTYPKAYAAKPTPDHAWIQMQDLGINSIQIGGGQEGNVSRIQLNPNHPYGRGYNPDWATNLEWILSKAESYGMKIVFHSMGSYWGTSLGIVAPMNNYSLKDPKGNTLKYTPLDDVETLLNQLAGDNSLAHNFLTDPRILWWCPINEARMNIDYVRNWTVQVLRMLHERGAKTSVCVNDGAHTYSESFPYIIPIIGDYVDYLQAHCYNPACIHACTEGGSATDMYALAYADFDHDFKAMINGRGKFPISHLFLTEFGCGFGTYKWHGGTDTITKQQQADYIKAAFDAAKTNGITAVFYHEHIDIHPEPTSYGFGFVDYDGKISNQLAYDSFKNAQLNGVIPNPCQDVSCPENFHCEVINGQGICIENVTPECYTRTFIKHCEGLYGITSGESNFDEACDVNDDGIIDVMDFGIMEFNVCAEPIVSAGLPLGVLLAFIFIILVFGFAGGKRGD